MLEVRVVGGPAGMLPVPSLAGGIVLKLRAWESRQAARDAEDLVRLLALVGDVEAARAGLKPAERRLPGDVRPLADERSRIWRVAADPDEARAPWRRLVGRPDRPAPAKAEPSGVRPPLPPARSPR